jgi:lysophospholipase L1-like esterase
MWGLNTNDMRAKARALVSGVGQLTAPDPAATTAIVCPAAGRSGRARLVNRAMRTAAADAGLAWVNPWNEPGPGPSQRLASDRFHPNDLGYTLMARPLGRQLGLEAGQKAWSQVETGLSV